MQATSWRTALLNAACRPYLKAGPGLFAYFFARGKLGTDPIYWALLERGLLAGRTRILDLGCGQALLTAWLRAAGQVEDRGAWPASLPPPPRPDSIRGIELKPSEVTRARRAFGPAVEIEPGDIRACAFGTADAVVVFDVLHYLSPAEQRDVLNRIRNALPANGLLLLRVGDAGRGLRHRYSLLVDRIVMALRGHAWMKLHCRSIAEWRSLLLESGFESTAVPMSEGTPFCNVLLVARALPGPSGVTADR